MEFKSVNYFTTAIAAVATFGIMICFALYITNLFYYKYNLLDRLFSFLLLPAVLFFVVDNLKYSLCVFRSNLFYIKEKHFLGAIEPSVAVFISAFNEDSATLERTISCCTLMNYSNKLIYLLDDSTNNELMTAAQDIVQKYKIEYIHRDNRIGYKAGAINEALKKVKAKYIMLLDADQRPSHKFLNEIVPILEDHKELAFVQTPQFYANHKLNRVADAAFSDLARFSTHICEGKSVVNAIFIFGTNVVIRVSALQDIGGFDEKSITEDLSTSFELHKKGYRSYYYNHILVEGKGPGDIPGYNTQQLRWAYGNTRQLKNIVWNFITDRSSLTLAQWQEYFLNSAWYFIGFATFLLMLCPVAFLLFDIHPISMNDRFSYLYIYLPYLIYHIQTIVILKTRGVNVSRIFWGLNLIFLTFTIYMKAVFYALIGKKIPFIVTPKSSGGRTSIKYFLPQIAMMIVMAFSTGVGIIKISHQISIPLVINTLWCLYCLAMLQGTWYFMSEGRDVPTH